jgi:hypothetical protein
MGAEKGERSRVTTRERNVLILVLAILAACGLVTLVSPKPLEPDARSGAQGTLPSATFTLVPTITSTIVAAPSLAPTSALVPPNTPAPPNNTPVPVETPAPTETPQPATRTLVSPLAMDWVLVQKQCISDAQWGLEFWLTGKGGTGEYTFYLDAERLHGPAPVHGFSYQMVVDTGSAAAGTFIVESGAQRVRSEFWIERPDCSHLAPTPTPVDPPTSGAAVSPLPPGSYP